MNTHQNIIRELKSNVATMQFLQSKKNAEENKLHDLFITNIEGKLISVHDSYYKTIGYSKDEILEMNLSEIIVTERPYEIEDKIKDIINEGFARISLKHKCKCGKVIDIKVGAIYNKNTNCISFFDSKISIDMLNKHEIIKNDDKLRSIFNDLDEVILEIDIFGNYIEIIPISPELMYKPKKEWIGKNIEETLNKKKADLFLSSIQKSLIKNIRVTFEYILIKDKKEIWFEARVTPRTAFSAIIITRDITSEKESLAKLKNREEKIEQMNERLKIAADSAGIGIWDLDLVSDTLIWDQWMHKLYGIDTENFEGAYQAWKNGVHPEDIERADKEVYDAINGDGIFDSKFRVVTLKGEVKHLRAFAKVIKDETGKPLRMTGVNYDITNTILAEKAIKESEEKYRQLIEYSGEGIVHVDTNENILFINNAGADVFGFEKQDLIKKNLKEFLDPDQFKIIKKQTLLRKKGFSSVYEIDLKCKPAGKRRLLLTATPLYKGEKIIGNLGIFRDITSLKKNEELLEDKNKELQQIEEELRASNEELYNVNEELEKRNIELVEAKEKAEESDRLKSAFVANMSHEIRTPMNGILGFSALLKKPLLTGEKKQKYIGLIQKSGMRMLDTINDIVEISKIEAGDINRQYVKVNVNEQLDSLLNFFIPEAREKNIELNFIKSLENKDSWIITDSKMFDSILINLIKNAIKYTEKGTVEFGYTINNATIEFFVKDTGMGIPEDKFDEIFKRFARIQNKETIKIEGSGLGLSIINEYVKVLGGKIWLESKVGMGTTFYCNLPVTN